MEINKEKFLAALDQLENHQNNKVDDVEEAKKNLEKIIRGVESLLCHSNSEFAEYLSRVNFEDIFEEIAEFNSREEVESKEKEFFSTFFTLYFVSITENVESIKNREEAEGLISALEVFKEKETFPLLTIYQSNEGTIEDTLQILEAMKLSFGESEETEKVIPSSSKGKEVEKNPFLVDEVLKRMNKDNVIELQKQVIKEKEEEIEKLKKELEAEREKNQQLKLELEKLQGENLETKTETLPKKY